MTDTPNDDAPIRTPTGQFAKGQSGNPKGGNTPQIFRDLTGNKFEIADLYRQNAGVVWMELLKLIRDPKTPGSAKVSAIKEYNDRAHGRPAQAVRIVKTDDLYDTIDVSSLSDEVLEALASARRLTSEPKDE
jgi:hypothetical protein